MPDHDAATLRKLLDGAYDEIARLQDELESARKRLETGAAGWDDLKTRQDLLRADLQQSQSRGDRLAGVVRSVVNNPTSQRTTVQGQLLVALEVWDGRRP